MQPLLKAARSPALRTSSHSTFMFRASPRLTSIASHIHPAPAPGTRKPSNSSIHTTSHAMSSHSLYGDDTPDSVKNAKGLHLITMSTPNGRKVQVLLEELADMYGVKWDTTMINIMTNEQKKDWFLRLNPNGRIPVIVDNTVSPPLPIMETSAELLYLADKYDTDRKISWADGPEKSEMLQWLFFWHGSGAPYQGQLNFFGRFAKEKLPMAIERFRNETLRVFGVLELRLSGKYTGSPREYLVGSGKGSFSVADIGTWTWVQGYDFSGHIGADDMKAFPHLVQWIERIAERPAVKRGTGDKYSQ